MQQLRRRSDVPADPPVQSWEGPFCTLCGFPLRHEANNGQVHNNCPERARRAAEEATRKELVTCAYCGLQAMRGQLAPAEHGLAHPKCRRSP